MSKAKLYREKLPDIINSLCSEDGINAIVLKGSLAQGKENPGDIDLSVFVDDNHRYGTYTGNVNFNRNSFLRYKVKVDMVTYTNRQLEILLDHYHNNPDKTVGHAAAVAVRIYDEDYCEEIVYNLASAPLRFVYPEVDFSEIPLRVFTEKFEVLHGKDYLHSFREYPFLDDFHEIWYP